MSGVECVHVRLLDLQATIERRKKYFAHLELPPTASPFTALTFLSKLSRPGLKGMILGLFFGFSLEERKGGGLKDWIWDRGLRFENWGLGFRVWDELGGLGFRV